MPHSLTLGTETPAPSGNPAVSPEIARVLNHPAFVTLRKKRGSLATRLSIAMLVIYYGFILLIAFAPAALATPAVGIVSIGIVLGLAVILSAIVLTGIYVQRANSQYDQLIDEIVRSAQ